MKNRYLAPLTLFLSVTFAAVPFLSPDFGGFDPNRFPIPQINPPAQPAGYAFAIWGVIYLWLVAAMAWGFWRFPTDSTWNRFRAPLVISLAVGTIWLPVALKSPVLASVLIWIMLITTLMALFKTPKSHPFAASLPLGLYAGWLSAASCVSLALLAAGYGWVCEPKAAVIFILLALFIASTLQTMLRRAPTYGLGVIWALIALVVQNIQTAPQIALLAGFGCLVLLWPVYKSINR